MKECKHILRRVWERNLKQKEQKYARYNLFNQTTIYSTYLTALHVLSMACGKQIWCVFFTFNTEEQ